MRHVADITLLAHCMADDDRPAPRRAMRRLRVFRLVGEWGRRTLEAGDVPQLRLGESDAVVVAVESKRLTPGERASIRGILDRHRKAPFDLVICSPSTGALPVRSSRSRLRIVRASVAEFLRQLAETGRFSTV